MRVVSHKLTGETYVVLPRYVCVYDNAEGKIMIESIVGFGRLAYAIEKNIRHRHCLIKTIVGWLCTLVQPPTIDGRKNTTLRQSVKWTAVRTHTDYSDPLFHGKIPTVDDLQPWWMS